MHTRILYLPEKLNNIYLSLKGLDQKQKKSAQSCICLKNRLSRLHSTQNGSLFVGFVAVQIISVSGNDSYQLVSSNSAHRHNYATTYGGVKTCMPLQHCIFTIVRTYVCVCVRVYACVWRDECTRAKSNGMSIADRQCKQHRTCAKD